MTAEQVYEVLETIGSIQLRRYERCVVADVTVGSTFESAGNKGFRPLFKFITGTNDTGTNVAMTAPVLQDSSALSDGDETYRVSFVMPAGSEQDSVPQPTDDQVKLRGVAERTTLAMKFSGRWQQSTFDTKAEELKQLAQERGLTLLGSPRFARYDPPWTLWFMRRNEVLWDIESDA